MALDALAEAPTVDTWLQVSTLVPSLKGSIKRYLADFKSAKRQFSRSSELKGPKALKVCRACHEPLPHRTFEAQSYHGWYSRLIYTRRNRWTKYPSPGDRRAQNAKAREVVLILRHNRWIEALRRVNPAFVQHLLATQGREAVLKHFRSLSRHQQKRLLKAVPSPPKRAYKGSIAEQLGWKAPRPEPPGGFRGPKGKPTQ